MTGLLTNASVDSDHEPRRGGEGGDAEDSSGFFTEARSNESLDERETLRAARQ